MAVTQNSYVGNGSTTTYSFTFPYLKTADVKAQIDATDTTAFTLPTATTLQFNTAPSNGAKIKIYRATDDDSLTATFYAGSSIKSEDLNDNFTQNLYTTQEVNARYLSNLGGTMVGDLTMDEDADIVFEGATADAYETTLTVADPTADRTITLPNVTGTVITTGDTGTVTATILAANSVDSSELVDGSIDTSHIADSQVTTAKLATDAVTGAKIADDTINSEHYVDGSIDTAHIADSQITTAKIANDAITAAKIAADAVGSSEIATNAVGASELADNAVDTAAIADNAVTNAKMADDSVGSAELVDGSVVTAALASNAVTLAKMADSSVGTAEIVADAITDAKISDNAVKTEHITNSHVTTAKINNDAVTQDKLADDSVGTPQLIDGSVNADRLASNAVTTAKIADDAVTSAKIAANAVTTTEIADAELTTLAGMQSGTASILAGGTALTATLTEINTVVDGKGVHTTISDSDAHYPTSGAVVDYVAAQIAPIGGLEVIADEDNFPSTQPASGVVISIADAAGIVVNGSGVSTTARTAGNGSDNVTINGFPSSLYSETLATGNGLMVTSTGSSNTYNYHKLLASESDVKQLSDDINDFNSRYRINAGEPSSNNDDGDLVWDTNADKMKVYDGTASAWKEVTSSGDFKYLFLCPAGGSGTPTLNGSIATYDLREGSNSGNSASVTSAAQLIVSIDGVIQKANTGTSAPAEGFALVDSNTIIFGANLASGSSIFIVQVGSAITLSVPADNTVATAKIQNGAVTTDKLADNSVTSAKIPDLAIGTSEIAIGAVATNRLAVQDGNVDFNDSGKIRLGTGNDLEIYHDGSHSFIKDAGTGAIKLIGDDVRLENASGNNIIKANGNVAELYHTGNKKLETTSLGARVLGDLQMGNTVGVRFHHTGTTSIFETQTAGDALLFKTTPSGGSTTERLRITNDGKITLPDNGKIIGGAGEDLELYSDGNNAILRGTNGDLYLQSDSDIFLTDVGGNETFIKAIDNGAVELYHNGTKKLETTADGVDVDGSIKADNYSGHNIIINGDCSIAQRGTSDTSSDQGYTTVDRFKIGWGGANAIIETHQQVLVGSDAPWDEGHRYAYKLMNGNQTSTDADDYVEIQYKIEAQDIASSGWDYESTSSYVTLSFWIKSSVSQNFYGFLQSMDGTSQSYPFQTGTLSANTWTKITKTIPGSANVQFDNNNGEGLVIKWIPYYGSDRSGSPTLDTWAAYSSSARVPNDSSTWWTSDDATFHLTGVQLEVGKVATKFDHKSYGQNLAECQRYYYKWASGTDKYLASGHYYSSGLFACAFTFPTTMRTAPTLDYSTGTDHYKVFTEGSTDGVDAISLVRANLNGGGFDITSGASGTTGAGGTLATNNNSIYISFSAEL